MVLISLILLSSCALQYLDASPVSVNDEFERKYEIHEDANVAAEDASFPFEHSSILSVRSAQNPHQFNSYPYQSLNQFNPYSQYSQAPLQLPAPQQGNHQYLAALQQYYAASRRPQGLPPPPAAYSQLPIAPQPAQLSAPQTAYQPPLGVLYSAASDVSQSQFSGNGVNYAF